MARRLLHTVLPAEENSQLRDILRRALGLSGTQLGRVRHTPGALLLDGVPARTIDRAHVGQQVTVDIPEKVGHPIAAAAQIPLDILYEDDDLILLNKPAGIATHPGAGHPDDTLANALAARMGEGYIFRPIGRLDRSTSGLLLTAKNAHAQHRLIGQMKAGLYHKEYFAIVCGCPDPAAGVVDAPISRSDDSLLRRTVDPAGAPARTAYRVLAREGDLALVVLAPETGRTHQIRVHMAHIGHPLAGDFLYGKEEPDLIPRAALHASGLAFAHPVTGQQMHFTAPLPQDMRRLLSDPPAEAFFFAEF